MGVVSSLLLAAPGHRLMETHYAHEFMVLFQVFCHIKILQGRYEKLQSHFSIYANACNKCK